MKISTRTRYGTRLMLALALAYDRGQVLLKNIAKQEEISGKYLSQIIIPLRTGGLVNSYRGARGGYSLARPPSQITVKEIVEILEGGLNLLECVNNPSSCRRVSICVTREVWGTLSDRISKTLDSVTLQDLVEKYLKKKDKKVIMYNI